MLLFLLMIRRPPRSTLDRSSAASDVYKRQALTRCQTSWTAFHNALEWRALGPLGLFDSTGRSRRKHEIDPQGRIPAVCHRHRRAAFIVRAEAGEESTGVRRHVHEGISALEL